MGKRPRVRRIGKGAHTYKAPSHRYKAKVRHLESNIIVEDIIHDPGHHGPLVEGIDTQGITHYYLAAEALGKGDSLSWNSNEIKCGNTLRLRDIPDSTSVFNLEASPDDGGKFVRSGGTFATVITHDDKKVIVKLPSGKMRVFSPGCRATIGVVAGGGRLEKPKLKASTNFYKYKAKARKWPRVRGNAMNAVDHPFGSGRKQGPRCSTSVSRNAPPGQKVGMIAPKRTGRKK